MFMVPVWLYLTNTVLFSVKAQLAGSVVAPLRASIHRVSASGIIIIMTPLKPKPYGTLVWKP